MATCRWVRFLASMGLTLVPSAAFGATLSVGPTGQYGQPCAAFSAAQDGDVIEIDAAGTYAGDVCAIAKNNLVIRGINGRAHIDAAGQSAQQKAIWVIQGHDTTVENIEFSGCSVPDQNGAGIRQEGANLTVRGCYFHDNEDGILTSANDQSSILIEYSEFNNNGFGDGYSHNMYIGHIASFTLRYSYSHHAKVGHLVKSRAQRNVVVYNRLSDEQSGTASYEIDLSNGGLSLVMGNVIEQGPLTENAAFISYGREGPTNSDNRLFVVNNTFVNHLDHGTFLNLDTSVPAAFIYNNVFAGAGTITNQTNANMGGNLSGTDPLFVNDTNYDYHLQTGSPCVDTGVSVNPVPDFGLVPDHHYVHPAGTETRTTIGTIDIGAYELGGGSTSDGGVGGSGGSMSGGDAGGGTTGGNAGSGQAGHSAGGNGGQVADASTDSPVVDAADIEGSGSSDDGGCGCRTSGGSSSSGWLAFGVLAAMLLLSPQRIQAGRRER